MREEDFVAQEIQLGATVHTLDGVAWRESPRGYCKPVFEFKVLERGRQKPLWRHSFLGYSHSVPSEATANHRLDMMVLPEESLREFDLATLKPRKRTIVRKAQKTLSFSRITNLESEFESMQEMAVTAAKRIGRGHDWRYYVDHAATWKADLLRHFRLRSREWWGVYFEGKLIAYNYSYLVEDTMIISAVKSHSDHLSKTPNDLLLFGFLKHTQEIPKCKRVVFGGWTTPESQNRFKEAYGFKKTPIPFYVSHKALIDAGRSAISLFKQLRQRIRRLSVGNC